MSWKPHITVATVIERDGKFLMIEELKKGTPVLNQPAGHLDPCESLVEAAIRETREESAWRFTPEAVSGIYLWTARNGKTFLRVTFCGTVDDYRSGQKLDEGIIRTVWMTREQIVAEQHRLRSPMVMNCIDDYLAGKRYPLNMLIDVA